MRSRVDLGSIILENETIFRMALGHEIAHWYMRRGPWSKVPLALQEGVAQLMGFKRIAETGVLDVYADYFYRIGFEVDLGILDIGHQDYETLMVESPELFEHHAYQFVRVVGVPAIARLVREGRTDKSDWIRLYQEACGRRNAKPRDPSESGVTPPETGEGRGQPASGGFGGAAEDVQGVVEDVGEGHDAYEVVVVEDG